MIIVSKYQNFLIGSVSLLYLALKKLIIWNDIIKGIEKDHYVSKHKVFQCKSHK